MYAGLYLSCVWENMVGDLSPAPAPRAFRGDLAACWSCWDWELEPISGCSKTLICSLISGYCICAKPAKTADERAVKGGLGQQRPLQRASWIAEVSGIFAEASGMCQVPGAGLTGEGRQQVRDVLLLVGDTLGAGSRAGVWPWGVGRMWVLVT